jgi:hypothetical protein
MFQDNHFSVNKDFTHRRRQGEAPAIDLFPLSGEQLHGSFCAALYCQTLHLIVPKGADIQQVKNPVKE